MNRPPPPLGSKSCRRRFFFFFFFFSCVASAAFYSFSPLLLNAFALSISGDYRLLQVIGDFFFNFESLFSQALHDQSSASPRDLFLLNLCFFCSDLLTFFQPLYAWGKP